MHATSSSAFIHPYLAPAEPHHHALDAPRLAQAPLPMGAHSHRHLLCGYRSKICMSVRAHKRNGSLHRFCELHRQQANENQKRWVRRRVVPGEADVRANIDAELHHLELAYHASYEQLLAAAVDECFAPIESTDAIVGLPNATVQEIEFDGPLSEWISGGDQALLTSSTDVDAIWNSLGLDDFTMELPPTVQFSV